jgi:JmjC domain
MRNGESHVTPLASLVAPGGPLHDAYQSEQPVMLRDRVPVHNLPGSREINEIIDASLLRWPYFTVLKEGIRADKDLIFRARQVGERKIDGFMDPQGVRKALTDGATLRLSAVSDWHRLVRQMAIEITGAFPANWVKSFVFYTPAGQRGMVPHRDPARVIVIQVEGEKEWTLFAAPEDRNSRAGIDIDPDSVVDSFCLRPGDVLYLPHSYPHAATATSATSSHVTFTFSEPTPLQLAETAIRAWRAVLTEDSMSGDPLMPGDIRAGALAESLRKHLRDVDPAGLVASTAADFIVR